MRALDRKLLRDLRRLWSQALTIALVVASGIAGFVTSLSAVDSLALARDRFYADGRFADLFASVKRAPRALEASLREVPGVADVQTTVEAAVRIAIPGVADPIIGQLIGVDRREPARMNRVSVSSGRGMDALAEAASDGSLPALVNEGFAQARGLRPGAVVDALVNGKQRRLHIVGTALSPEYIFAGLWGMPDLRGFGVFWVDRDALAAAYDMQGAFNRAAVKLAPGASAEDAVAGLSRLLARYGGRDVHGRDGQVSHQMLDNEIKEQRVLGTVLPAIFLGVAAFLLNVVVTRLVGTQREQIAALKALGYPNARIAMHYLKLVLIIVGLGLALGLALGDRLGAALTGLYAEFFHFPRFDHQLALSLAVLSAAITLGTAVLGTLSAILATVRLAPAEAMRPPAPGHYRRTLLESLGFPAMGPALRMIVRNMERRPLRAALGMAGVAAAVAITILGNYFRDAMQAIVDTQFSLSLRGDLTVWTAEPGDAIRARLELARLPGVLGVETTRFVPVEMSFGHRHERVLVRGFESRPELYRLVDVDNRLLPLEGRGLLLTDRLAAKLGVRPGHRVELQTLEGEPRRIALPVGGTVRDLMGLNAYIDRHELNRVLGDGDLGGGQVLAIERGREAQVLAATQALPRVAGAFSKATLVRNMEEISARNVRIMSTLLTVFASVIAVGVVYNNARIVLAERGWELASLRVLGFTRAEVSGLLLGEMAITVAVALPLAWRSAGPSSTRSRNCSSPTSSSFRSSSARAPMRGRRSALSWPALRAARSCAAASTGSTWWPCSRRGNDMKTSSKLLVAAGVAASLLALAWAFAPRPLPVEAAEVTEGPFEATVDEDARTRLRDRYVVSAPLAGRLDRIALREGDAVAAGDVVATLTPSLSPLLDERSLRELRARVEAAQAGVERASARLEGAQVAVQQARNDARRSEELARQGFVAPTKLEGDRLALQAAQKDHEAALAERHIATHEVEQARAALGAVQRGGGPAFALRSPVAGRVLRIHQASEASLPLGAALLELGDTSRMEVVAELLTTDAVKLAPGQAVHIERWGGAADLAGRLRLVEPGAFTKVSALGVEEQRVRVLIDMTSPVEQWRALGDGYRVGVRIVATRQAKVLRVPLAALFPRADEAGMAVFVIDGHRARLQPVEVAARSGTHAWVRGQPAAGTRVILYPASAVVDGARVAVREAKP
jgi:putative ABC transport system permease protein